MKGVWRIAAMWRHSQDSARRVQRIGVNTAGVLKARAADRLLPALRVTQVSLHALSIVIVIIVIKIITTR
jgi:hypothetical protein